MRPHYLKRAVVGHGTRCNCYQAIASSACRDPKIPTALAPGLTQTVKTQLAVRVDERLSADETTLQHTGARLVKRRRSLPRNILGGDQSEARFGCLCIQPSSLAILSSAFLLSKNGCVIFLLIAHQVVSSRT
jgi:hypothetical protein